jgi:hypothetical protein
MGLCGIGKPSIFLDLLISQADIMVSIKVRGFSHEPSSQAFY